MRASFTARTVKFLALGIGLAAVGLSAVRAANSELDVTNGQTDLSLAATYGGTAPTATSNVTFTNQAYSPANFTVGSSISIGTLNDLSPTALTISNTSGAADSITLNAGGDTVAGSVSGDLLYVGGNSSLTLASGAAGTATELDLILAASGNFDVAGAANVGAIISGTGFGITKTGAGTLTLSGANTYSGATVISVGTLRLTNANALQNSALTNSATLDLRSNAAAAFATGGVTLNNGSTINVGNNGSGTGQTLTLGGAVTLNAATTTVNVTSGNGYTLALGTVGATGANGTQTINAVGANVTITTYNGSGGGDQSLVLAGNGNFTIGTLTNGAANREINPTVNTSGTVTINGSTASNINNDTASGNNAVVTFNNGTTVLDFSNLATPTNLITRSGTHATTFFTLGGGTVSINGKTGGTATSQNFFGGTTFAAGASAISITNNGTSTTTLVLNAITRNVGGTVDFSSPSGTTFGTNGLVTTSTTTNVNGILGGYATVGGTTWAVAPAATGAITGLADGSYSNTASTALSAAATAANVDVAAAGSNASTASQVINSLRFNDATAAATVDATNGLTLTTGGILVTSNVGNHLSTISGGTLSGAASADLVVIQNNTAAGLTISSTIANNTAATALTKSGAGLVTLSNSANTYTGITYLNGGTLNIAADASLGTAPATATAAQLTMSGGTLQFGGSFNLATNRGITLAAKGGTIDTNGNATTYAGVIAGSAGVTGTFTKTGGGTLTLSGASTYGGLTAVNGGTLSLDSAGTTVPRLAGTGGITVNTGGILQLANSTATVSTNRINNAATITLSGGTFNTGGLQEGTATGAAAATTGMGALTLTSTSTLDFGSGHAGSSVLAFANSSGQTWSGTLQLVDFTAGTDYLNFASTNGLTASQLAEITYSNGTNSFVGSGLDAFGNVTFSVTAVPEPSTWAEGLLMLGVVGYSLRRRFRVCR